MTKKGLSATKRFERLRDDARRKERYVLRLYINDVSSLSREALAAIETLRRGCPGGRGRLEVVDGRANPQPAGEEQISASPTLERKGPPSLRRLNGNLSDAERVQVGLDLPLREGMRGIPL